MSYLEQANLRGLSAPVAKLSTQTLFLSIVGLYLLLSPVWAPGFSGFRYENARWFELILLTLVSAFLVLPGFAGKVHETWSRLHRIAKILIAVALAGGVINAVISPAPHFGAMEVGLMTQLVGFALCVATVVTAQRNDAERALSVSLLGGAALLVMQFWLVRGLYLYENKIFSWTSPFLEFANVRFFGQYQAYTLLVLPLCISIFKLSGWKRYGVYFVIANFWALQWMVGTRAVWVGFILAVVAVSLIARQGRARWLLQQVLLVIAGALIFALYLQLVPKVTTDAPTAVKNSVVKRGTRSIDQRVIMAREAVWFVKESPLTGVGPGQFGLAYRTTLAAHPHNSVLQLLSEYGLIAGGAAVGIGVGLLMLAIRRLRPPDGSAADAVDMGLAAALIMGLGDSLFSGNIIMPHAQVLLALLAGWLLGRELLRNRPPATKSPSSPGTVRMVLVYPILLAWAVTMIFSLEYWHMTHSMTFWLPDRPPHFWQYGRLDNW